MPKVSVVNRTDQEFEVFQGRTLLVGAREAEVPWRWYCGGQALCGTCARLGVDGELGAPTETEQYFIEGWGYHPAYRLGCQARVTGEVKVINCADEGFEKEKVLQAWDKARADLPGAPASAARNTQSER